MKKNRITLVFGQLEEVHLGKDVFLRPYYLGKALSCEVSIVYMQTNINKDLPASFRGCKLIPIKELTKLRWYFKYILLFLYLIKNSRKIDYMLLFHLKPMTFYETFIYKILNRKGKVWVKLDMNTYSLNTNPQMGSVLKYKSKLFNKLVDVVTCETQLCYKKIKESSSPYFGFKDKLILMPNGFDEELLNKYDVDILEYDNKENIMITVGRLGSFPKNTTMLLNALSIVNLRDWKFYLIGPIEDDFQKEIDYFFSHNPEKKDNVIFTSEIRDKKQLWNFYNQSKVFVLTSVFESFGLVLLEALRFKNFLISTPVGYAPDVIENGKYGVEVRQGDADDLARKIQSVIDNDFCKQVPEFDTTRISWDYCINIVLGRHEF